MTIAVIPTSGREEIMKITIPRLLKQVDKVIMAGHNEKEYFSGTDFYICPDGMSLGSKWQFCINKARDYSPDVILISSSGGVFRDDYFQIQSEITGSRGLYYLDFQPTGRRMIRWYGYTKGGRYNEPIGLGRMITKEFLDRCDWQVYDTKSNCGLDYSMMQVFAQHDGKIAVQDVNPPLRISSYKYPQKDSFDRIAKQSKIVTNIEEILQWYGLVL